MRDSGYPFYDLHRREHAKFISRFVNIKREVVALSTSKVYLLFQIQIFLIDWLLTHTCKTDKHFGNFLKNARLHSALQT